MDWEAQLNQMKKNLGAIKNTSIQTSSSEEAKKCSLCNGTGFVFVDYNTVKECSCGILETKRQQSRLSFASIPEAYKEVKLKDMTLAYYTKKESVERFKAVAELVKWYIDNLSENIEEGRGIYCWSETKGSGKTMMATALANELINKHRCSVKFATSLDILDAIRDTYNNDSEESESKLLSDLVSANFLVIDDFGTERITDWVGEKFYQIINKRYINKKVTFYTSNYDLNALKYDDRITNRIVERTFIAQFPDESVRKLKAVGRFDSWKEGK